MLVDSVDHRFLFKALGSIRFFCVPAQYITDYFGRWARDASVMHVEGDDSYVRVSLRCSTIPPSTSKRTLKDSKPST